MGLAISDEHRELAATTRRWLDAHAPVGAARAALEAASEERPEWWTAVAGLGWIGLAVSEGSGGQGYGLPELAVVLEETGRGCLPGPLLPTTVAAVAVDRWGGDPVLLADLLDGTQVAGLGLGAGLVGRMADGAAGRADGGVSDGGGAGGPVSAVGSAGPRVEADARVGGDLVVAGTITAVWGGGSADVLLVPVGVEPGGAGEGAAGPGGAVTVWCLLDRSGAEVRDQVSFDPTRRLAEITVAGLVVPPGRQLRPDAVVGELVAVLAAAEALGVADWCVETAAAYARARVQFGRPIGQFQAVKHRCATMLTRLEAARAAVWDAARCFGEPGSGWGIAAGAALALSVDAAFANAQDCIQVLGGVGYTWEHDAHLFLKRSTAVRQLLAPSSQARRGVARAVAGGQERRLGIDLPPEAEPVRECTRAFVAELQAPSRGSRGTPRWPTRATSRPTGPSRGGSMRRRSSSWSSTSSSGRPRSAAATCRWPAGCCRPSSATARSSSRSGGCRRRCGARSCGARCSASPTPAATWPA